MLRYATMHIRVHLKAVNTNEHGELHKRYVRFYYPVGHNSHRSNVMRPLTPKTKARYPTTTYNHPVNYVFSGDYEQGSDELTQEYMRLNVAIASLNTTEFVRLPFPLQFLYLVLKQ